MADKDEMRITHLSHIFFMVLIFFPVLSISVNTLSSTESLTISSYRTLVSPGGVFELGFFQLHTSSRWYLGIWYKTIPDRTYVWIANRDNPLSNSIGTLRISGNNLHLLDQFNSSVWSTNLTGSVTSPEVAELLPNGNLVLKDSKTNDPDGFLWQSFHFPTDTLLPQMKLGWNLKTGHNRFLISWKTPYDPSSGDFSYKLETRGLPELFFWKGKSPVYRSGPWDGIRFNGKPDIQQWNYIFYNFTEKTEELTYIFPDSDLSLYSNLKMTPTGTMKQSTWIPELTLSGRDGWNTFSFSPKDQCDLYLKCGPYSYCDTNTSPVCNCIKGFNPTNLRQWALTDGSAGCVRKTPLKCSGDRFMRLKKMKLPDTMEAIVDKIYGFKECEARCLRDCNCTAFASTDIRNGKAGCVIWTGKLRDIRNLASGGQDFYVRLASADFEEKINLGKKIKGLIIGVSFILLLGFIIFLFWKREQKRRRRDRETERPSSTYNMNLSHDDRSDGLLNHVSTSSSNTRPTTSTTSLTTNATHSSKDDVLDIDFELPFIDFTTIARATNNFSDSNRLGEGGYGIVYKQGRLPHGQDVAVKRLSDTSKQGLVEFENETKLIAKLQHINLVRILACCVDQNEKILIYEYLENRSLDSIVFNKAISFKLDWGRRYEIINGMARGLLYLHQDSRFRIIHRDFKTSNILLDRYLTPKISDFGMARIFAPDTTKETTGRIVGTYGYMSPEYAMHGIYSTKSDVYSFGVTLLEIICGRKNFRPREAASDDLNLVGIVYYSWKQGNELEVIDPHLIDSMLSFEKIKRCLQIGLLCVQEYAFDRPTTSSLAMMLASEIPIPIPNHPGFFVGKDPNEQKTDPTKRSIPFVSDEFSAVNQVTVSIVQPR